MKFLTSVVAFLVLCFAGCATRSGNPLPASAVSFRMEEMIPELPSSYWEISPPYRGKFIAENYPAGVPDDYVVLGGQGAQSDIAALRLDGSTLAVVSGTQRYTIFPDGDHQIGYDLAVLRRTGDGWENLTATVFPFAIPPHGNVSVSKDGTVVVTDEGRKHRKEYRFDGKRFLRAS